MVTAVWIPLEARLTPANVSNNEIAPELLTPVIPLVRFVLGDQHYHTDEIRADCACRGATLIAFRLGNRPHEDPGKEVRRVFHKVRSVVMENLSEHFKGIFDAYGQVPTKGLQNTQRFALGAIFVYQLALHYRFENQLSLNQGLKPFLKAA